MTDKRILTYDPNPHGGDSPRRNWFKADTISNLETQDAGKKHNKTYPVFEKISDNDLATDRPRFAYGSTVESFKHDGEQAYEGSKWTQYEFNKGVDANTAALMMTSPRVENYSETNKSFHAEFYGFYNNAGWQQKYSWEIYNASGTNFLDLPVKGISFTYEFPKNKDEYGVHKAFADHKDANSKMLEANRGCMLNRIVGLWYHPVSGKYHIYDMTINGNNHAPSENPDLKAEDSPFYSAAYLVQSPNTETGNQSNFRYQNEVNKTGVAHKISVWANEKILEECCFCGFAVNMCVSDDRNSVCIHSCIISNLSPVPFHIDRTGNFRAVYGAYRSYNETFQDEDGNTIKIPSNFRRINLQ